MPSPSLTEGLLITESPLHCKGTANPTKRAAKFKRDNDHDSTELLTDFVYIWLQSTLNSENGKNMAIFRLQDMNMNNIYLKIANFFPKNRWFLIEFHFKKSDFS